MPEGIKGLQWWPAGARVPAPTSHLQEASLLMVEAGKWRWICLGLSAHIGCLWEGSKPYDGTASEWRYNAGFHFPLF